MISADHATVMDKTGYPAKPTEKMAFREKVLSLESVMKRDIENGHLIDVEPECKLEHLFTHKDQKYGCHTYARKFFMPKGALVVGKIHKHEHLNFIMQGSVAVVTEFGKTLLQAPLVFVSEPGTKRTVLVLEDCTWVTVHLTENCGEENLEEIESEVIASSFDELERHQQGLLKFEVMP